MKLAMNARWRLLPLISVMALTLAGCGGGSDKPSTSPDAQPDTQTNPKPTPTEPENQPPVVSINATETQLERTAFTLTAEGSDVDGSVASYVWTHNAPLELTETATNTATPSYTVPDINQDITVTFTVTVSDDKGATSSASQEVVIKRKVNSVTLTGVVTDKPIANAQVVVQAASAQAQVSASSEGQYTATLIVDESEADRPVVVTATGVDAQSQVKFVSVLNSVVKLAQQAGEDGILEKAENFGVNITNVTTAEYALMSRAGASITTDAELDAALLNVDADEKITLAALIKIVVDNDKYALPDGVSSTLTLVEDEQTAQQFADQVNESDPDLIDETKTELKQDVDLIDDSIAPLSGEFILQTVKHYDANAYHINLADDGTGTLSAIDTVAIERWVQESNLVSIVLKQPLHISTWEGNTNRSVYIESLDMTILAENDVFRTVDIVERGRTVIVGDDPSDTAYEKRYTSNLLNKQKSAQLSADELSGVWYMELSDNDGRTEQDPPQKFEFKANGQVIALDDPDDEEILKWRLDGNTLVVDYEEGEESGTVTFWFTKKLGAGYQFVSLDTSNPDWSHTEFGILIKAQPDVRWTEETLAGRWHGFIGKQQDRYDMDLFPTGELYLDLHDWGYTWKLGPDDGILYRTRYAYGGGYLADCEGIPAGCYQEALATHKLIAVAGEQYYVSRVFERFDPNGNQIYRDTGLFIYRYQPEITQTAFFPRNLADNNNLWVRNEETKSWSTVYIGEHQPLPMSAESNFDSTDEYPYWLGLNDQRFPVKLSNGKLVFTRDDKAYYVELQEYNAQHMQVCVYAADKGCQQADKQDWFFQPTLFEVTAQGEDNGQLFPSYQQVIEGRGAEIYIEPNQGYLLDTITGCDGQLEGDLYLLPKVVQSCEVTATFKQDPSVAARAGITDPVLAQCVNNTHAEMPEQVTELYCEYQGGIQSLAGLTNLTELHTLALTQLEVTALDLSGLDKLTSLRINDSLNGLTSLTMTNPEHLTQLSLINNGLGSAQLAALELERFTALTSLDLSNNQLTELSGAAWPELRFLEVNGNQLATLSIDKNLKLQWLRASGNQLKQLDISANTGLEFVSVSNNQLSGITTAEHPVLTGFLAWSNRLSELQLEGMPKLKDLEVEHNPLARLDTSHNPELTILWIHGALIRQLDLSANLELEQLYAKDLAHLNGLDLSANPRLHYLEIGNNNHWQSLTLADEAVLQYLGMASNPGLLSKLSSANARQVSGLNISSTDPLLVDLTPFDNLTALTWRNAGLQQLDLSALPQLSSLDLSENPFSQLDLSPQTQLQQLDLSGTALPGVDISALADLHTLDVGGSAITVLDVGHNPKLQAIYASHSAIEVVSGLESLENKWADIGLMNNPLSDDTIAYLADLRDHQGYINLSFSKLFVPVIESSGPGSVRLELYYNGNEYYHQAYFEPEPGYVVSEASGCPGHWEGNSYAIEPLTAACTLQVTFVEEVPLSQQIGLTDPALSLCVDNSGFSRPREVIALSCHQAVSTTDFAPLAAFHNLTFLQLHQLQASELDFSALPGLTSLSLAGSKVTALVVHPDAPITTLNLEYMSLTNSELAALNLARFTHLEELSLFGNELTEFSGDALPKLKRLELGWNLLTTLNLTQNSALQYLSTENNPLQVLDISGNPQLIGVRAVFNQLSRIEFGDHPELESLALWNNQLTTLMLNNMPKLRQLYASSNRLTQLDVSGVSSLETLEISDNTLTSLDLSGNVNLQWLVANRMEQLESLDLSHNTQLRSLSLENYDMWRTIRLPDLSNLTFLNVSGSPELFKAITHQPLPALEGLHVNRLSHQIVDLANFPTLTSLSWTDAKLWAAYLSEAAALRVVDLSRNPLIVLELSRNYQLTELKLNNTQLTALELSHMQALESLEFSHTPVTSLDLQYHPRLYNVYASAAALTEVSGIESVESKFVNLELRNNPLSDDTVAYLTRMREQGYIELRYSQASVAEVKVTGNGVVDTAYLELTEGQTFDLQLSPVQGYQIGSVTGCPGELLDTVYRLGPLQGYCVLEVEFVPLP